MKHPHITYRLLRQREGVTLDRLSIETDIPKPALLAWELGRSKLMRSDIHRIRLALLALNALTHARIKHETRRRSELQKTPGAVNSRPILDLRASLSPSITGGR